MFEEYKNRYTFDKEGNVYSAVTYKEGKPLKIKSTIDPSGYERFTLKDIYGKQHTVFKHKLVLLINGVLPKEGQTEVNHKDKNILNNVLSNLEWCSGDENRKHKYSVLCKPSPLRKFDQETIKQIRLEYKKGSVDSNQYTLAKKYNCSQGTIGKILRKERYNLQEDF